MWRDLAPNSGRDGSASNNHSDGGFETKGGGASIQDRSSMLERLNDADDDGSLSDSTQPSDEDLVIACKQGSAYRSLWCLLLLLASYLNPSRECRPLMAEMGNILLLRVENLAVRILRVSVYFWSSEIEIPFTCRLVRYCKVKVKNES